jgi:sterol desaturase/sphingolipid hydroxylase (fatty acid hydroxylase superfamily)
MDALTEYFHAFKEYASIFGQFLADFVYTPVTQTVYGILTGFERQSAFFLLLSFLIVYIMYRCRYNVTVKKGRPEKFGEYFKTKKIYTHPSAKLDYIYFFTLGIADHILSVTLLRVLIPATAFAWFFAGIFDNLFGEVTTAYKPGLTVFLVYGFLVALFEDFSFYWTHRTFHTIPFLWEFHKVHHSAEVLEPFTAARVHPVEGICEGAMNALILGILGGVMVYIYGNEISPYTLAGVNYIHVLLNIAAGNLRHSQYWLSFGPLEYFISSPAQHQIHHSTNPKHYNKNYSTFFSFWDWLFGTLYLTSSKREEIIYGLGENENRHFRTLKDLYIYPFIAIYRRWIKPAFPSRKPARQDPGKAA